MKGGQFFLIPESPADLDRLRLESAPLDGATRPAWLDRADRDYYRYLGRFSSRNLGHRDRKQFLAEIQNLEAAGLLLEPDRCDPEVRHLYIRARPDYPNWSIGIYAGDAPFNLNPAPEAASPVLTRDNVTDVPAALVADPFMVRTERGWFMFFEVLNWVTNKGEIAFATSGDGLNWSYQRVVLAEPFHLSYPYVFESTGHHYMIPESLQSGEVRLYRAENFPDRWVFCATLLRGEFVDPSLFFHHGRAWILAGTGNGSHDTLRLFGSTSLTGQWVEHPSSPVVRGDARAARPAGRVLPWEGGFLRFSQNCQSAYGEQVRGFQMTELTETAYSEQEIEGNPILGPGGAGWNARGMHHIDAHPLAADQWLACVDGWTEELAGGGK